MQHWPYGLGADSEAACDVYLAVSLCGKPNNIAFAGSEAGPSDELFEVPAVPVDGRVVGSGIGEGRDFDVNLARSGRALAVSPAPGLGYSACGMGDRLLLAVTSLEHSDEHVLDDVLD
jgi:hypothetical protein